MAEVEENIVSVVREKDVHINSKMLTLEAYVKGFELFFEVCRG